jgi:hypothetical protein
MRAYLYPWEKLVINDRHSYKRRVHNGGVYFVVHSANQWWAWNADTCESIPYETAEEAMNAYDDCLRKLGYILLTEETMLLL